MNKKRKIRKFVSVFYKKSTTQLYVSLFYIVLVHLYFVSNNISRTRLNIPLISFIFLLRPFSHRIEEAKRAIKRPSDDRYEEIERKRTTTDRRFEAPPPPRFDSAIARPSDTYRAATSASTTTKRDDYKRDTYKRDLEVPRHSSKFYPWFYQ